jgi:hypothetical protein
MALASGLGSSYSRTGATADQLPVALYSQPVNRIAVEAPTVETAKQLFYPESKLDHVQRTFGRAIAPDPIAIRNDQNLFVQMRRRCSTHRPMWDIDSARNVTSSIGFRRSCIDKKDLVSSP